MLENVENKVFLAKMPINKMFLLVSLRVVWLLRFEHDWAWFAFWRKPSQIEQF